MGGGVAATGGVGARTGAVDVGAGSVERGGGGDACSMLFSTAGSAGGSNTGSVAGSATASGSAAVNDAGSIAASATGCASATVSVTEGCCGGMADGSGVAKDSLGVAETDEAPDFFTIPPRPFGSIDSGLAAAFSIFALGNVPSGAMFATTPCRSMPASANEGLAGGRLGSSHLSIDVFFLVLVSAFDLAGSVFTIGGKGLLYRDLDCLGELMTVALPFPSSLSWDCDRKYSTSGGLLAQGYSMRDGKHLLLYTPTTYIQYMLVVGDGESRRDWMLICRNGGAKEK